MRLFCLFLVFLLLSPFVFSTSPPLSPQPTSKNPPLSEEQRKGFLGVQFKPTKLKFFEDSPDYNYGIVIQKVVEDSAAERYGIKTSDIIVEIDGNNFDEFNYDELEKEFSRLVKSYDPEDSVEFKIIRFDRKIDMKVAGKSYTEPSLDEIVIKMERLKSSEAMTVRFLSHKEPLILDVVLGGTDAADYEPPEFESPLIDIYPPTAINSILDESISVAGSQKEWDDLRRRLKHNEHNPDRWRKKHVSFLNHYPDRLESVITKVSNELKTVAAGSTDQYIKSEILARLSDVNFDSSAVSNVNYNFGSWDEALNIIEAIYGDSRQHLDEAFSEFDQDDKNFVAEIANSILENLQESFTLYRTWVKDEESTRFFRLAAQINFSALLTSAESLNRLNSPELIDALKALQSRSPLPESGLSHKLEDDKIIRFGSVGNDHHSGDIGVLIDFGGNDFYNLPPLIGSNRIVIDLGGNDRMTGDLYSSGGSLMGVGLHIDKGGDDMYRGGDFSVAATMMGFALLVDQSGNDIYHSRMFGQGSAIFGFAHLLDFNGNDQYLAGGFSQGSAGPGSLAILIDNSGNDQYTANGVLPSRYSSPGIFAASSQGFGYGIRGDASGGIGILLDIAGDDNYDAGEFSQGTGYYNAWGMLSDLSGNDRYHSGRYGIAAAAHSAIGSFLDADGNDYFQGAPAAVLSAAWDLSITAFIDISGDDEYDMTSSGFSASSADHNGFSLFWDQAGSDHYLIPKLYTPSNEYHGGSSFSFLIDSGMSTDVYSNAPYSDRSIVVLNGTFFRIDQ